MTDCRQQQWAQNIRKSSAAPNLCSLPPTTEAFEQNVRRAHHQVALWYSALGGDPPAINAVEYGWESDDTNRRLIPRNMADGISLDSMLLTTPSNWLGVAAHQNDHARVGTVAAWGTNLFAQCFVLGSGSTCANPFSTKTSVTDITDNSDSESDDDNHDNDNDYSCVRRH